MDAVTLTLELLRFVPLLFVMGYAGYKDYKTGEVPNKVWWYTIFGVSVTVAETVYLYSIPFLALTLTVMLLSVGFSFLLFLAGNGGADSKAFMMLGFSAPLFPIWGFLWPLPLPFAAMLFACVLALPMMIIKKSDKPLAKRGIRFLPFLFIGLVVSVIL